VKLLETDYSYSFKGIDWIVWGKDNYEAKDVSIYWGTAAYFSCMRLL
jgi:hypothetical protein